MREHATCLHRNHRKRWSLRFIRIFVTDPSHSNDFASVSKGERRSLDPWHDYGCRRVELGRKRPEAPCGPADSRFFAVASATRGLVDGGCVDDGGRNADEFAARRRNAIHAKRGFRPAWRAVEICQTRERRKNDDSRGIPSVTRRGIGGRDEPDASFATVGDSSKRIASDERAEGAIFLTNRSRDRASRVGGRVERNGMGLRATRSAFEDLRHRRPLEIAFRFVDRVRSRDAG